MKVLHVITGLGIGGAEQQLRLLLSRLPAEVECEVATLTNPGPVAEALRADGVDVTHLAMSGNRDLTVLPRLTSVIRDGCYDVVHTHLYRAGVYGRIAARLAGVRAVVATEHSLGATQIEGRPLTFGTRALYRAAERLGTGTVAVSATVERRLGGLGVPAGRIHLVPNGIDPAAFRFSATARATTRARLGIPEDAYVVGGVGRLVPAKNFDDLITAVAALPGTRLLLVGDGPEQIPLLRLAQDLGVQDRVRLTGAATADGELAGLLAAMDLFVSPSAEESFGLALLEALAAGLPALYASCPAVADLPPAEAPGARRIALHELPAALREERRAGPRRLPVPAAVERYHIARTAERVVSLYEAALYGADRRIPGQAAAAPAAEAAVPHPAEK
ncbi:glycosyltransferase [Actinacidiphila sp. ITFR-21]|uniref:glycosyltransferase n=1 Tax=Actinacidiphila sp. ITFR-21 TaxID=3075199 RepID=UPI00288A03DC|nr:glycosyltransferase [Streptomyces sp. ITFR-21]WNI16487.1 glycosyltransferase [Streptomyces sp. ITFR-21]